MSLCILHHVTEVLIFLVCFFMHCTSFIALLIFSTILCKTSLLKFYSWTWSHFFIKVTSFYMTVSIFSLQKLFSVSKNFLISSRLLFGNKNGIFETQVLWVMCYWIPFFANPWSVNWGKKSRWDGNVSDNCGKNLLGHVSFLAI